MLRSLCTKTQACQPFWCEVYCWNWLL